MAQLMLVPGDLAHRNNAASVLSIGTAFQMKDDMTHEPAEEHQHSELLQSMRPCLQKKINF
jgi:hypothetical protein